MDTLLILAASLGTAYLSARASGARRLLPPDAVIAIVAGAAGVGLYEIVGGGVGLPIFFACALALGLESRPRRSAWR